MSAKILVSACLAGMPCRYDGKSKEVKIITDLVLAGKAVMFCPEMAAGLPTPRWPSEIQGDRVVNLIGEDLTEYYKLGAQLTLDFCKERNITRAILKSHSPSCSSKKIYDGTFSNRLIDGEGFTTKLLRENGFIVIDEHDF